MAGATCTDPKTGAKLDSTTLTPNQALRAAISEWKDSKQQELLSNDLQDAPCTSKQTQMQLHESQDKNELQQNAAAVGQEQDAEYEAGLARDLMLAAATKRREDAAEIAGDM